MSTTHARDASGPSLKLLLALVPLVPVMWVIWLMARRVVNSDELEQRLHLIALSAATGLVAVTSLVGGFLCAAGVIALGVLGVVAVLASVAAALLLGSLADEAHKADYVTGMLVIGQGYSSEATREKLDRALASVQILPQGSPICAELNP